MFDKLVAFMTAIITLFYTFAPVTCVNPETMPKAKAAQSVKIMTYNIYVMGFGKHAPEKRRPLVIENIRRNMPDSFGVQECDEGWYEALIEALPEYAHVGVGRNGDGGEASPVFYKKDKFDLVDSGTFWLSDTPDEVSKGWDSYCNRVCSYAILKDKKTGFTYAHFNAHFDHLGIVARNESVALVSSRIAKLCPDIPALLTGDLNDSEGSGMYQKILGSGMNDSKYLAKYMVSSGTYHGYSSLVELTRPKAIDFVFVNDFVSSVESYTIDKTQYDGMYASDHHPVVVEMTLFNK